MGEYARGVFDGEALQIKVGAEVMRDAEADTFRTVNALPRLSAAPTAGLTMRRSPGSA